MIKQRCKNCGKQIVTDTITPWGNQTEWIHLTGMYHCNIEDMAHGALAKPRTFSDYFNAIER